MDALDEHILAVLTEASAEVIDIPPPTGDTGETEHQRWMKIQGQNMTAVKAAMEANGQLLVKNGLKPKSMLGKGKNGMAFLLPDGRVLKITTDRDEAVASHKIEGRRSKYVVNIERAFKLRGSEVYGIVQEQLTPLSEAEKQKLNAALKVMDHLIRGGRMKKKTDTTNRMSAEPDEVSADKSEFDPDEASYGIMGRGWDEFVKIQLSRADDRYAVEDVKAALTTMKKFNIDKMMDELHARGISFYDYHSGNIMKRGNQYVITDLGQSTVFGGLPPVHIESVIREADEESSAFEDALIDNKDALIRNEIRPIKLLGAGSRGEAYLCKDGSVLKVTMDRTEAQASMKVMGRDIPGVVRVKRVFVFPGEHGFYGILQERLTKLSNAETTELMRANKLIERVMQRDMRGYRAGWQTFTKVIALRLKDLKMDHKDPKYIAVLDAMNVYRKFGLDKMMDGLFAAGVKYHDYHTGNIMKRGSEYVVTDLGASQVDGAADVPILEGLDESTSDQVSVVFGKLQPFTAKQAKLVRGMARQGKAVLLLKKGELPYKSLRVVIEASLPDVEGSVEVYDVGDQDLPHALQSVMSRSAALKPGVAVTLYSEDAQSDATALRVLDSMVIPKELPGGLDTTQTPRDKVSAKRELDPHVFSDRDRTGDVFRVLGIEEELERMTEVILIERYLQDIGGVEGTKKVIQYNLPALQKRTKMKSQTFLGAGTKGAVYDIGNNRILKITSDLKDVSSALKLKGRHLPHVTTIYDVFQLKAPPEVPVDVYGLVADKVEVLPEAEMDRFNEAFSYVRDARDPDKLFSLLSANKMDEFFDALRQDIHDEEVENSSGTSQAKRQKIMAELPKKVEERVRMVWDRLREFKVTEMIDELTKNGVIYADYKGDNIGKRNGEYVLLDVGGKSEGPAPPPIEQESVLRESVSGKIRAFRSSMNKDKLAMTHTGGSDYGPGLYFATVIDDTRPFGPNPKEYELTVTNPIIVGKDEDPALFSRVSKALKIPDDHFEVDGVDKNWTNLMGLVSMLVDIGQFSWAQFLAYLKKLGYDGIYVHKPERAKGDYVAVFDPAQVKEVPTVTQELFAPSTNGNMVNPARRSQSSPWSTGATMQTMATSSFEPPVDPSKEEDELRKLRGDVGYIVKGVTGDLMRK